MMRVAVYVSLVLIVLIALPLAGCKSESDKDRAAELFVPTPLALDPTDDYTIAPWWSNGKQLLQLEHNAAYALFDGVNHYETPLERGRWFKQSYAVLWLNPYTEVNRPATRVGVSKVDGRLALTIGNGRPMFAIAAPPAAPQDQFMGRWTGPAGTLRFDSDMRYTFTPATTSPKTGAMIAGHAGKWKLVNGAPLLTPDTPSVKPLQLTMRNEQNQLILSLSGNELQRVKTGS